MSTIMHPLEFWNDFPPLDCDSSTEFGDGPAEIAKLQHFELLYYGDAHGVTASSILGGSNLSYRPLKFDEDSPGSEFEPGSEAEDGQDKSSQSRSQSPSTTKRSFGNNPYGSRGCESCIWCRRRKGKVTQVIFQADSSAYTPTRKRPVNSAWGGNMIVAQNSPRANTY